MEYKEEFSPYRILSFLGMSGNAVDIGDSRL